MLYLAIPAHNEAATIGVLLWRLRTVLAEFPREYEVVVYDDASTDSTPDVLAPYTRILPLTVLRGETSIGYAGAVDALVRYVSRQTRYPRRDAILLLQGDFTDPPALIPEFAKRFEGGADVVVGERSRASAQVAPKPVRRLLQATPWLLRMFVGVEGVDDITGTYRLIRISVLRDLLRSVGDAPICAGDVPSASADFLLRTVPLARRVETIAVEPTWAVRLRESRRVAVRDGLALARWAWRSRGRRAVPSTAPEVAETPRGARPNRNERDARPDVSGEHRHEPRTETRNAARRDAKREVNRENTREASRELTKSEPLDAAAKLASRDARKRSKRRKRRRDGATLELHLNDGTTEADQPVVSDNGATPVAATADTAADIVAPIERAPRNSRKKRRQRGARPARQDGNAERMNEGMSEPIAANDGAIAGDDQRDATGDGAIASNGSADAEMRARKRGRRGRRGGARRNRMRDDGTQSSNGSPDDAASDGPSAPSAPSPSPE